MIRGPASKKKLCAAVISAIQKVQSVCILCDAVLTVLKCSIFAHCTHWTIAHMRSTRRSKHYSIILSRMSITFEIPSHVKLARDISPLIAKESCLPSVMISC